MSVVPVLKKPLNDLKCFYFFDPRHLSSLSAEFRPSSQGPVQASLQKPSERI